uniref:Dynein light chain n=1 Tax=Steinernema glaseri TaxID=37863 RepID=A0A1I8ARZ2_9BILA
MASELEVTDYVPSQKNVNLESMEPPTYDEIKNVANEVLDKVVSNKPYNHSDFTKANQQVVEEITAELVKFGKPFKYIVCCVIMQTGTGAGLNVSHTCFWNRTNDSAVSIRWENKVCVAVVNVFSVSL